MIDFALFTDILIDKKSGFRMIEQLSGPKEQAICMTGLNDSYSIGVQEFEKSTEIAARMKTCSYDA